ncbi:AimR family lysis-lysogeny pheromone receptor [Cytobacillus sp. FSL K6-0129]|uniref:AimR family lysis-lysogeny pheromone receptor n=1 Tax=Cytobacillus sp. FSL K6-0129 TaxID=2921421 RepID=UPI0030F5F9DC
MLRKIIRSLMERPDKDITNLELAKAINYDDSTISKWFRYENELSFPAYLLSIRYLSPEREDELMDIIAEEMINTENRQNCRLMMEYASTRRNFPLLQKLINSQRKAPRPNNDWAAIYDLSLKFQKREHPNEEILNMLIAYKPKTVETKVFLNILKINTLYMIGEYSYMLKLAKSTESDLENITNTYIKETYTSRINEIFARAYLYQRNDVKKARFFAKSIINSKFMCANYTSHLYHLLGTSYVFENRETSLNYFNNYVDILRHQKRFDLVEEVQCLDIFFVNTYWGQTSCENTTNNPLELMHYYAKTGKVDLVEELYMSNKEFKNNPFALCYLGMARSNPQLLLQSVANFIEDGNKFFAEIPRKQLEDYPDLSFSASVMCKIKIA